MRRPGPALDLLAIQATGALVLAACALAACQGQRDLPPPGLPPGEAGLRISGERFQVGFGTRVELRASVEAGEQPDAGPWSISWRQLWGPKASITRDQGGLLELVTPQLPAGLEREAPAGGLVPLSAAQAGRMVFLAEATSGSTTRSSTAEVIPAFPSASWPRVALGVVAFLPGRGGTGWRETEGAGVKLGPGPAGLSSLVASSAGWHGLEGEGGQRLRLRSGTWLGSADCGRGDCHPREYRSWLGTGHATIFTRGLTGTLSARRGPYRGHCLACHTLGYQPGAANGGFDDAMEAEGWSFPERPSREAWAELPVPLRERANVQCEHCHGPGWFFVGYGDDVCAQCHDHPPEYVIPARWRSSALSRAQRSIEGYGEDLACGGCHRASVFLRSVLGHDSTSDPGTELETRPRGVTCPVCHDPHGSGCDHQVRLCGTVEIPGLTYEAGQGALCVLCHTGDADVFSGTFPRPFTPGLGRPGGHGEELGATAVGPDTAPHASQALVVAGRGGRFLELSKAGVARYTDYPHLWVEDGCVGCHSAVADRRLEPMDHLFRIAEGAGVGPRQCWAGFEAAKIAGSRRTRSCAPCHGQVETLDVGARGDYDGDGVVEGLVDEVAGLMALLRAELERQLGAAELTGDDGRRGAMVTVEREKMVVADSACVPLRQGDGQPVFVSRLDPALGKAAFNYLLVSRDGSGGIHNPQYVVRLLQDTIRGLEKTRGATVVHRWRALDRP